MRIFITGASGFIGGAITKALTENNHEVLALSRSEASDSTIERLGGRILRGNLGEISAEDLKGYEVVIHCAAFVGQYIDPATFWRVNVTGAEQLLEASARAGVKRFIHMGTEAAVFNGQNMVDIDETYPRSPDSPFLYSRTKAAAEEAGARRQQSRRRLHDPLAASAYGLGARRQNDSRGSAPDV